MSSYSSQYGCGESEALHVCHSCPEANVREFARTQRTGFIKKGYLPTILADPLNRTLWTDGIANGDIIVCPETSGTFDPGDPKELKGFGKRRVTYGKRTMKLNYFDPVYYDNYHFYNEIVDRTDLVPWYVTSSLIHIFDTEATIKAKDPVVDDLEEEIIWSVECEVISKNLPSKHLVATIDDLFECSNF